MDEICNDKLGHSIAKRVIPFCGHLGTTSLHHFQMKNARPKVLFAFKRQISPQNFYMYGHTQLKSFFILSKTLPNVNNTEEYLIYSILNTTIDQFSYFK